MEMVKKIYDENLSDAADKAKYAEIGNMLDVLKFIEGVKAIALINDDGHEVAVLTSKEVKKQALYMTTLAVLSMGQRVGEDLVGGNLESLWIKTNVGMMYVTGAGKHLVLTLLFDERGDFKRLFGQDFAVIERVKQAVSENYPK